MGRQTYFGSPQSGGLSAEVKFFLGETHDVFVSERVRGG